MPKKPRNNNPDQQQPLTAEQQPLTTEQNQNVSAESPAPLLNEPEAPHDGDINAPPPEIENEEQQPGDQPAPRRRRRRKTSVVVEPSVEDLITKDDVDDMHFALDMLIFTPSQIYLNFETPEDKMQLRMARIAARLHIKYFGKNSSDEFKICELLIFWILVNCWRKFGGNDGQRNNRSLRAETSGKNPLDAPISA